MMTQMLMVLAALVAFGVTGVLGKWLIPFLHKIKYGQPINDIGPTWHKKKQGTPTMGGIMFIIGGLLSAVVFVIIYVIAEQDPETPLAKVQLWAGVLMAVGFALMGFADDYIKVARKNNKGLSPKQKLVLQLVIGLAYCVTVYMAGQSKMFIPFYGYWDLGIFYIPVSLFIIVATVNAVNLTDGLDGLASSVTVICAIFFMLAASMLGYLSASITAAALAGSLLGFLLWNFHPARVFMGDTGSMFLGGMVCTLAFAINAPILILPVGFVYFCETLSVMIQTTYYKITKGKRLFKMTPIHHHFEMMNWSEVKIVAVFSLVTVLGCIVGLWLLLQR